MATSGTFWARWESSTWAGRPKYYNWSGSWSKSGTTITLTNMQIYMGMVDPNAGGTGSGTDSITVSPGGSAQSVTFTWSGGNTSNTQSLNNVSFTVSGTATSRTIYCYIDGENTGSYTLSFDPAYVAPNTPTITATADNAGQVTVVYGTTSFGTPSTGTVTLYGGTTSSPTTSLDTYSSTGNKTFVHTGLAPGTTYYYRARANNGQLNSSYSTEVSATTSSVALYGSVNGQAKRVTKLYGPMPTYTYTATYTGGNLNGVLLESDLGGTLTIFYDADEFMASVKSAQPALDLSTITLLKVTITAPNKYNIVVTANGTDYIVATGATGAWYTGVSPNQYRINGYGLLAVSYSSLSNPKTGTADITATPIVSGYTAKQINKLYGSVNGVTKRIY